MNLGFVGNGADKFTPEQALRAIGLMKALMLLHEPEYIVSGHSPLGGVDLWAEEIAAALGVKPLIFAPADMSWAGPYGFKARNLDIARHSDVLYVIVSEAYPDSYWGRRWEKCYHHSQLDKWHVKSGGCWTGNEAKKLGKKVIWVVV